MPSASAPPSILQPSTPRDFGARGNDSTDDTAAFLLWAADLSARALAGRTAWGYIPAGRYVLTNGIAMTGRVRITGDGRASVLVGRGTTNNSGRQLTVSSDLGTAKTATATLTAGPISLTLNNVTGLTVGQVVALWLGSFADDATLPDVWLWNRIKTIVGNVVTFTEELQLAVNGTSHLVYAPPSIAEDVEIGHLAFERDVASGNRGYNALGINFGRNVWVHDCHFQDMGFASVIPTYLDNCTLERIYLDRSTYDGTFSTASGGFIGGWVMRNFKLRNVEAHDVGGIGFSLEGRCYNVDLDGVLMSSTQTGTAFPLFLNFVGTQHGTSLRNARFAATGNWNVGTVDVSENVTLDGNTLTFPIRGHRGYLSYNGEVAGPRIRWAKDFDITPGMSGQPFTIPDGWYARVAMYVSSTTGITNAAINGASGTGFQQQLVAGRLVEIATAMTTLSTSLSGAQNYRPPNHDKTFVFETDGNVPANTRGRLELEYFQVGTTKAYPEP